MDAPFALPGSGPIQRFEDREVVGFLPRGHIDGLVLSNDTTDATNDIAIAAGSARSTVRIVNGAASTLTRDQIDLDLPISIIKQIDVAFAPENYDPEGYSGGDRSGGRSSSALSNTTWHYFLVGGAGLAPDVMIHDSATQASVLAEMQKIGGYAAYRHIMSVVRTGAVIKLFKQYTDGLVVWSAPVFETVGTPFDTAQRNYVLTVPTGINGMMVDCTIDGRKTSDIVAVVSGHPDVTLAAVTNNTVPTAPYDSPVVAAANIEHSWTRTWRVVDASAQIAVKASQAVTAGHISTFGYRHPRGRDP